MATVTHEIATTSTSNVTSYASGAFTPVAGDLLVVFVVASGTVAAGSVTSSAGLTFTKITSALKATSADTLYCFVSNQPAAASSQTVTFDCTGDAATGAVIFVSAVAGMSRFGSVAVRQSAIQSNQAAGGTPAPAFGSSCLTGNVTLGLVGNATNPAGLTPPTSWTENAAGDTGYATPTTGAEYVYRNSGFTGTTVTWGSTSATAFGSIIIELDTSSINVDEPGADGGFWGGVMQCMGGLAASTAAASALMASALGAQVQATGAANEHIPAGNLYRAPAYYDEWQAPVVWPVPQVQAQTDTDVLGVAPQQGGGFPPGYVYLDSQPLVVRWGGNDDAPFSAATMEDQGDGVWQFTLQSQPQPQPVAWDDPVTVSMPEEQDWEPPVFQPGTAPLQPFASNDEWVPPPVSTLADDDAGWAAPTVWPPTTAQPVTDTDYPPPQFAEDDAGWRIPPPWPATTAQPFTDTDVVAVFADDDAGWSAPIVWPVTSVQPITATDEVVAPVSGIAYEEAGPRWFPVVQLYGPGGGSVQAAPPFLEESEAGPLPAPVWGLSTWAAVAPVWAGDEQFPGVVVLDGGDGMVPVLVGGDGNLLMVWMEEDPLPIQAAPLPVMESDWTPPIVWPATTAQPFTDTDVAVTPAAPAFAPDDPAWTAPIIWQLARVQAFTATDELAVLAVAETEWTSGVPPLPLTFRPYLVWQWEQSDAAALTGTIRQAYRGVWLGGPTWLAAWSGNATWLPTWSGGARYEALYAGGATYAVVWDGQHFYQARWAT